MSRSRRSRNLLVPIGLTVTAAVVGLGLYFWLGDDSKKQSSSSSSSSGPVQQGHDPISHDRTTEVNENEFEQQSQPRRQNPMSSGQKKTIVVVVREDSLGLLWNLPTPLNLNSANVFILVHSSGSGGNPEKVYKFARDVFPKDYPQEYIMPYTMENALLPLLRHLAPEAVYMDESLVGEEGASVSGLLEGNWVGAVVVAVGAGQVEGGWRQNVQRFGKRCAIVERSGIRGDWAGRVG